MESVEREKAALISGIETDAYATAFATLTISIPDGRLSIFNRDRPKRAEKG